MPLKLPCEMRMLQSCGDQGEPLYVIGELEAGTLLDIHLLPTEKPTVVSYDHHARLAIRIDKAGTASYLLIEELSDAAKGLADAWTQQYEVSQFGDEAARPAARDLMETIYAQVLLEVRKHTRASLKVAA